MHLRLFSILRAMGLKYVVFRIVHELMRKTGLMKRGYKTTPEYTTYISRDCFVANAPQFFPMKSSDILYTDEERFALAADRDRILSGEYPFFSGQYIQIEHDDWLTNPKSGFKYSQDTHWTYIADINPSVGDIKFVWERARFSWAHILLRADLILGTDSARFLLDSILSFVRHSPVNCGPHWRCSQEISLRVLNWTAILYTYRTRLIEVLGSDDFNSILLSIHSQIKHVFSNRYFARIAVRNNHAITEALGLYATGILFPWFPESRKWKKDGKQSLEREGLYQIYSDGSYVQHSFNYQRVVVQQYTFALSLARVHGEIFSKKLNDRLITMVDFLKTMQDKDTGFLPNYGANDGALFFPVSRGVYRDFRPQIDALYTLLHGHHSYSKGYWRDETAWFCGSISEEKTYLKKDMTVFPEGGYYYLRNEESSAMIRCATYRHRPSQADQLHIDIWDRGKNILRDCGSFTYVMTDPLFPFFVGTSSHNTVQIAECDQMARGPRFIWYDWPKRVDTDIKSDDDSLYFKGSVIVYRHIVQGGIHHERTVKMNRHSFTIEIADRLIPIHPDAVQIWNLGEKFNEEYQLVSFDETGTQVKGILHDMYYSDTYGVCDTAKQLHVPLQGGYLKTIIKRVEKKQ